MLANVVYVFFNGQVRAFFNLLDENCIHLFCQSISLRTLSFFFSYRNTSALFPLFPFIFYPNAFILYYTIPYTIFNVLNVRKNARNDFFNRMYREILYRKILLYTKCLNMDIVLNNSLKGLRQKIACVRSFIDP